ncbi:MAG: sodium:solute symporter family protein [Phycisphaerales bacterium]|nr:sodium:solute symporter family protein [Phycisphaerales bacterium]
MNVVLVSVLIYVALQLAICAFVARRVRSEDDYFIAGRRLGPVMAMFSIFATWFGAETCIGSAGAVYEEGLAGCTADPFGYCLCLLLMGAFLAAPLWRRKLVTLGDLIRDRFGISAEKLVVLLIVPTSVIWAAAQIRAFGHILSASSALNAEIAITIAAAIVITYTVLGGLLADVITDLIQGIVLILGLVIVGFAVTRAHGGVTAAWGLIDVHRLNPFGQEGLGILGKLELWAVPICGSLVAQELVARASAARSASVARRSALFAGAAYFLLGSIPVIIGLLGPAVIPDLEHGEQILPLMAQRYLPTALYILFAGALASAILSTVDSALLSASSLVSHNIVIPLLPKMDDRHKVRWARFATAGFGVIAYLLALHAESVYHLVEEASAFGSSGVLVTVLFALFTRWGGPWTGTATLATGMGSYLLAKHALALPTPYLVSLGVALATFLIVAFAEPRTRDTHDGVELASEST